MNADGQKKKPQLGVDVPLKLLVFPFSSPTEGTSCENTVPQRPSTLSFSHLQRDTRCNSDGRKCQEYYIRLPCDIQGAPLRQINNFIMTSCEDFRRNAAGLVLWPAPLAFARPVVGAEVRLRRSINTAIPTVLLDCNLTCVPAATPPGRFSPGYISSLCKNCQTE